MNIITLDAETYFDNDYTLSKLSTEAYVRDPRFEAHGWGIRYADGRKEWLGGDAIAEQGIDWPNTIVLCHHAQFDGFILSHHYGIKPGGWLDTLSMARFVLGTHSRLSLDALTKRFGLQGKTIDYSQGSGFKGLHWREMAKAQQDNLSNGCLDDLEGTWGLFCELAKTFPAVEYPVVDLTVRMFTEPRLVGDAEQFARVRDEDFTRKNELLYELGVGESDLSSNDKFVALLESLGVDVDMKMSAPTKTYPQGRLVPAVAKSDRFMQDLLDDPDEQLSMLARARVETKSTINETRAGRLHDITLRGCIPIYLNYAGASTRRWSGGDSLNPQNFSRDGKLRRGIMAPDGYLIAAPDQSQGECIAHGQMVLTLRGPVAIQDVELTDLVFDGVEFVQHEGVICKGEREVISYQGLTATPDHRVYVGSSDCETQIPLLAAAQASLNLSKPRCSDAVREEALRKSRRSGVSKLRGAWDQVLVSFGLRGGSVGAGEPAPSGLRGVGSRQDQQRWPLRAGEPTAVDEAEEREQSLDDILGAFRDYVSSDARLSTAYGMLLRAGPGQGFSRAWLDGRSYLDQEPRARQEQAPEATSREVERPVQKALVYDIINAGPRHRFVVSGCLVSNCRLLNWLAGQTDVVERFARGEDVYLPMASAFYGREITKADKAERQMGKGIELGCGFGMGPPKLKGTLAKAKPAIILTDDDAERGVKVYRDGHLMVVALWKEAKQVLRMLADKQDFTWRIFTGRDGLLYHPNGTWLDYSTLEYHENEAHERNWRVKTRDGWKKMYGAKLVENVIQWLSRIVTSEAMVKFRDAGYSVVGMSHDDVWLLCPDDARLEQRKQFIVETMAATPPWAPGLPLGAECKMGAAYG